MAGFSLPLFEERVAKLRASFPDGVTGLLCARGSEDAGTDGVPAEAASYAMQVYLTNMQMKNTIFVIGKEKTYVASRQCSADKPLEELATAKNVVCYKPELKQDLNGDNFAAMLAAAGEGKLGVFTADLPTLRGEFFAAKFAALLTEKKVATVDVLAACETVTRVKDTETLARTRAGGKFCGILTQNCVAKNLLAALGDDPAPSCQDLATEIANKIEDPTGLKGLKKGAWAEGDTAVLFEPVVQVGDCPVEPLVADCSAESVPLTSLVTLIGAKWQEAPVVVGRTYLVDATGDQKEAYLALAAVRESLLKSLKPGAKVSEVVAAAKKALPEKYHANLTPEVGFGVGWHGVSDPALVLSEKSDATLEEGNVLVTRLRLQSLETTKTADGPEEGEEKTFKYVLQFADTAIVSKDEDAEKPFAHVVTNGAEVSADSAFWEDLEESSSTSAESVVMHLRNKTEAYDTSKAGIWAEAQAAILAANREASAKLTKSDKKARSQTDKSFAGRLAAGKISLAGLRSDVPNDELTVDVGNDVVYVPICGKAVPFHGSLISNTRQATVEGQYEMRLTFKTTVAGFTPYAKFPEAAFVKEVSLRADASEKAHMEDKRTRIREIIAGLKKREKDADDGNAPVAQVGLVRQAGGPRLTDVFLKPAMGLKAAGKDKVKTMSKPDGDFEAHENGFRFTTRRHPKPVDILFSNIKHVIAAPHESSTEGLTGIHLVLHSPIYVGDGDVTAAYIQLYTTFSTEGEQTDERRRRSDRDEAAEEEAEKRVVQKTDEEFVRFVAMMDGKMGKKATCEIPLRKGYITGNVGNDLTVIAATQRTLCSVLDPKVPFVLSMAEVEVVVFERIVQGSGTFDVVFVLKDYMKDPVSISNIPSECQVQLKDAMCSVYKIKYYEVERTNLGWKEVMKEVRKEVVDGTWDAWDEEGKNGWEAMFNLDASNSSEDDEESESDEVYSSDDGSSSDDAWSGESSREDSSASGSDSDSESSLDTSEGDRRAKKRPGGGGGESKAKRRR